MTRQPTERFQTAPSMATAGRHETISTTYRHLRVLGFDECEAGNLTAYVSGVAIGSQPWTVRELSHLLFLRDMNRVGRRWSKADDRAAIGNDLRLSLSGRKRRDAGSSDGRMTLLSLFRRMSGPGSDLKHVAPPGYRSADALVDQDREKG